MLLEDIDFTDYQTALEMAQRAARTTEQGLEDYMALTAIGETYRPYAAAHDWLEAHPKWKTEITGSEGFKYDSLQRALAALEKRQAVIDGVLGLKIPASLQVKVRPLVSELIY